MKTSRIALLTAVLMIAIASGAWFMLSPALEKQDNLNNQEELLDSIETGGGTVIVDETTTTQTVDFYDEPNEAAEVIESVSDETPEPELSSILTDVSNPEIGEGIGILEIDKIDLKLPVVEGATEDCLKTTVGRVSETAAIGGIGNAVIAGHRSYTYGDYFNRLGEMEIGDIICYAPKYGESMRFEVFEITEILPGDQIAFIQPEDESIITLYTCTPVRTATHRLLVRAIKI